MRKMTFLAFASNSITTVSGFPLSVRFFLFLWMPLLSFHFNNGNLKIKVIHFNACKVNNGLCICFIYRLYFCVGNLGNPFEHAY